MSQAVADLIAKKFIQRRDVKAVQMVLRDGTVLYTPHGKHEKDGTYSEYYPWSRAYLDRHLAGEASYGHYLLDKDDNVKLFAFDVDLETTGSYPDNWTQDPWATNEEYPAIPFNPREAWLDRSHPARSWMKYQFRMISHLLMRAIETELGIPTISAYSGGKGIHVYGFTSTLPAKEAREGAFLVLEALERFKPSRGENFFKDEEEDHLTGFRNLSIELFPKQNSLEGKDLGNLMRLPLGRNLKNPNDPTFFVDPNAPMAVLQPLDPEIALTATSPFAVTSG